MNANQTLQEYADNSGSRLNVDRARGVIPGVKLLGRVSKKGREYPPGVMAKALPLYEGMRVNVDHVDPGQRRSLRDRIGLVKNVTSRQTDCARSETETSSLCGPRRCGFFPADMPPQVLETLTKSAVFLRAFPFLPGDGNA